MNYKKNIDPVLLNIYNGCWLCNYSSYQFNNNKLCNRNFFDELKLKPYDYNNHIIIENKIRNMNQLYNKYCIL